MNITYDFRDFRSHEEKEAFIFCEKLRWLNNFKALINLIDQEYISNKVEL